MSSIRSISFFGYGRFGQALGGRLKEVGIKIKAFDNNATFPESIRAKTLQELIQDAQLVIIATPIATTANAVTTLLPFLTKNHIVSDVGSVKTGPTQVMQEILGKEVPWVATHPLFGPTSLALGERPLRTIICPNEHHPKAVSTVANLYKLIDCEVQMQDAESHDRNMAESHALAYFVAKGFLDSGVTLTHPHSPPSVKSISRTVDAVREDAAHLFASLHRENPYAQDARQRLLNALEQLNDALSSPQEKNEKAHAESGALHFSKGLKPPPQLLEARELIDTIDKKLLDLLAQRARVSLRAAQAKATVGKSIRDPERETSLLSNRKDQAHQRQLDPNAVSEIFQAIIRFSRNHQAKHGD